MPSIFSPQPSFHCHLQPAKSPYLNFCRLKKPPPLSQVSFSPCHTSLPACSFSKTHFLQAAHAPSCPLTAFHSLPLACKISIFKILQAQNPTFLATSLFLSSSHLPSSLQFSKNSFFAGRSRPIMPTYNLPQSSPSLQKNKKSHSCRPTSSIFKFFLHSIS